MEQIIDEADEYKVDFYSKRKINIETNKANNREKEKVRVNHVSSIYHALLHKIHTHRGGSFNEIHILPTMSDPITTFRFLNARWRRKCCYIKFC